MEKIADSQKKFYLKKYLKYGDDPRSLSYNDKITQYLRFKKIAELFKYENSEIFSIHEIGCGLAHFKEFLEGYPASISYSGSDIIEEFIKLDGEKFPDCSFYINDISQPIESIHPAIKWKDYYCLSGTFNPKEDSSIDEWESFIFKSMKNMFNMARKGMCVNFITSYSEFFDNKIYYADPKIIFNWCIKNCSRFVAISQDSPLYEFFVYVYKEEFIRQVFSEPEFTKYFK